MFVSAAWRAKMESPDIEDCRLKAYRDCAGVWTIGTGHTGRMAPPKVMPGMVCTKAQADAWLTADLGMTETALTALLHAPFTAHQFDALADLAFNIGIGAFKSSTVLRLFNAKHELGAANALLAWNRAGGKVLRGLVRRRALERSWFLEQAPEEAEASPAALLSAPQEMARRLDHPDSLTARITNRAVLALF